VTLVDHDPPHHSRPRRIAYALTGSVLVVLIAVVAVVGGAYVFRSHPRAKTVSAAVDQYRKSAGHIAVVPVAFERPAPGVYSATGHGDESISAPKDSQHDGAVMPITVTTLTNGCWRWRIDYNTAHWHAYDYCPKNQDLLLVGQQNFQAWDLGMTTITNTGTYTCNPPRPIVTEDPKPGATVTHTCIGNNTAAPGRSVTTGPATVVGLETLRIGGVAVAAIHETRTQTMRGPQTGEIVEQWWFERTTGLPLRCERSYRINTASPIGKIAYREDGTWQLSTLIPHT
jgi:uncharacterized membrane protein